MSRTWSVSADTDSGRVMLSTACIDEPDDDGMWLSPGAARWLAEKLVEIADELDGHGR